MDKTLFIGITMDIDNEYLKLKYHYISAVERTGAIPLLLPPSMSYFEKINRIPGPRSVQNLISGLIISGGGDIPPEYYGEKPETDSLRPVSTNRIDFELKILEKFIELEKPVLGICYGMQLINVFFGGSLYQDIKGHREGYHEVTIQDNSLIPPGTYRVNSSHHQAIKQKDRGIKVLGFSSDGIIEAITHIDHKWLFGIQWHPERMDDPSSRRIFENFVTICRMNDENGSLHNLVQ